MKFSTWEEEREANFAAYERLKERILSDFGGQYVVIAEGELVGAFPTFDEAKEVRLRRLSPSRPALVFQAGHEPSRSLLRIGTTGRRMDVCK